VPCQEAPGRSSAGPPQPPGRPGGTLRPMPACISRCAPQSDAPAVVGWNLFHAISDAFKGVKKAFGPLFKHVVAFALESIAPAFGIPPGLAGTIAELVLHAHAGDHKARTELAHRVKDDPKLHAYAAAVSAHAKKHPDFAKLKAHGAALNARS
jgi:hypothetical protein